MSMQNIDAQSSEAKRRPDYTTTSPGCGRCFQSLSPKAAKGVAINVERC